MTNFTEQIDIQNYLEEYLISEYEQLLIEIRYINDKVFNYSKILLTIISSYILYTLVGSNIIFTYDKKPLICCLFNVFGLMLSFILFFIFYISARQFAVSKKHRIRYWKSIHAIRDIIVKLSPSLERHFLLPTNSCEKKINRPSVSNGEFFIGLFITIVTYIFFMLCIFYYIVFLEIFLNILFGNLVVELSQVSLKDEKILNTVVIAMSTAVFVSGFVNAFYPRNAMWYYYENLQISRIISVENPYFKFYISRRDSRVIQFISYVVWFCIIVIVSMSIYVHLFNNANIALLCLNGAASLVILISQVIDFFERRKIILERYQEKFPFLKNDFL